MNLAKLSLKPTSLWSGYPLFGANRCRPTARRDTEFLIPDPIIERNLEEFY